MCLCSQVVNPAISELRGALRRQAKPSCKEIARYQCRLGSIGNPLDVAVRVICPHIKEEL